MTSTTEQTGPTSRSSRLQAWSALTFDAVLILIPFMLAKVGGSSVRNTVRSLDGTCLTWSYGAPLVLLAASIVPLLLAFHADRWHQPPVRRLVDVARALAVLSTIGWFGTTMIVAYLNTTGCRI